MREREIIVGFLAALARELQARKLPFMLIGGQAVLLYEGSVRFFKHELRPL